MFPSEKVFSPQRNTAPTMVRAAVATMAFLIGYWTPSGSST
ncbi:MAG: hypothetical protein ABSA39_23830 [Edaphobacter sp.]